MQTQITELILKLQSQLENRDFYFVSNIALSSLAGQPFFQASFGNGATGAVQFSTEDHTYWSPSVAALVDNRSALIRLCAHFAYIVRDYEDEAQQLCIGANSTQLHISRAFHNSQPHYKFSIPFVPTITHYNEIEDDGKTNSDHPYHIEGLDFIQIGLNKENPLAPAVFLQQLFAQYDMLIGLLSTEQSPFWTLINNVEANPRHNACISNLKDLKLKSIQSELSKLIASINSFHEKNAITH